MTHDMQHTGGDEYCLKMSGPSSNTSTGNNLLQTLWVVHLYAVEVGPGTDDLVPVEAPPVLQDQLLALAARALDDVVEDGVEVAPRHQALKDRKALEI